MLNGSLDSQHATGPVNPPLPRPRDSNSEPELFIGASSALRRLALQAEVAAPRLQLASLEGEAGTGKHLFAQILHQKSPLATASFRRRDAREWLANEAPISAIDGTLYLDRIDLLASTGQHLLLSFVKSVQTESSTNPHLLVLTSSHTPLLNLAAHGHFLPDLAFRLAAVRFTLPPLREQREAIGPIAQAILERLCRRYQQPIVTLSHGALQHLMQHSWPGNVRELASVLESAIIDSPSSVIAPQILHLSPAPVARHQSATTDAATIPLNLDAAIRHHIRFVLDLNRGNKLRAARQLGISRSTLYRILAGHSIPDAPAIHP